MHEMSSVMIYSTKDEVVLGMINLLDACFEAPFTAVCRLSTIESVIKT